MRRVATGDDVMGVVEPLRAVEATSDASLRQQAREKALPGMVNRRTRSAVVNAVYEESTALPDFGALAEDSQVQRIEARAEVQLDAEMHMATVRSSCDLDNGFWPHASGLYSMRRNSRVVAFEGVDDMLQAADCVAKRVCNHNGKSGMRDLDTVYDDITPG